MRARVRALYESGFSAAAIAKRLGVTKSTVAFHMRRLDAPIDERFGRRYDWAEIQRAYDTGLSIRECAKRFGFNLASWHQAVLRGAVIPRPRAMPIELLLVRDRPHTNRSHLKNRLLKAGIKENRCEQCGITEWRGEPLSMSLHHVNGDGKDNRLENIAILCPNCHAQTPNYGGKNGHRRPEASAGADGGSAEPRTGGADGDGGRG